MNHSSDAEDKRSVFKDIAIEVRNYALIIVNYAGHIQNIVPLLMLYIVWLIRI